MQDKTRSRGNSSRPLKKSPGRSPLPEKERGARYNIYLAPPVARFFKRLGKKRRGKKSLSAGITLAYAQLSSQPVTQAAQTGGARPGRK